MKFSKVQGLFKDIFGPISKHPKGPSELSVAYNFAGRKNIGKTNMRSKCNWKNIFHLRWMGHRGAISGWMDLFGLDISTSRRG